MCSRDTFPLPSQHLYPLPCALLPPRAPSLCAPSLYRAHVTQDIFFCQSLSRTLAQCVQLVETRTETTSLTLEAALANIASELTVLATHDPKSFDEAAAMDADACCLVQRVVRRGMCVVCGVWCVVCGAWCMMCGVWWRGMLGSLFKK
jgi:hypothetical protein